MDLKAWEATIKQMVDEASQEPRESGKQKLLLAWRARLAKETPSLEPFEIDLIVQEVRKRLTSTTL